jgi:hypothetical protein
VYTAYHKAVRSISSATEAFTDVVIEPLLPHL